MPGANTAEQGAERLIGKLDVPRLEPVPETTCSPSRSI